MLPGKLQMKRPRPQQSSPGGSPKKGGSKKAAARPPPLFGKRDGAGRSPGPSAAGFRKAKKLPKSTPEASRGLSKPSFEIEAVFGTILDAILAPLAPHGNPVGNWCRHRSLFGYPIWIPKRFPKASENGLGFDFNLILASIFDTEIVLESV